jgi:hypothetical protein
MVLKKIPTFDEIKTWVNNNADVPNADYADSAGQLSDPTVHDAGDFNGTSGIGGQYLQTDGTGAAWADPPETVEASETNDGSDITNYKGNGTLVNVTGSGVLIGGAVYEVWGGRPQVSITVDGGTTYSLQGGPKNNGYNNNDISVLSLPVIRFESSLLIENSETGHAIVKQ